LLKSTGYLSPKNYKDSALAFFADKWVETTGFIIWASGGYQTVYNFSSDILKGLIVGVRVKLHSSYETSGDAVHNIAISNNGGSSFSTAQTQSVTGVQEDYILGSRTDTWGLSWSGVNDLSLMELKNTATGGVLASEHVEMEFFYVTPEAVRLEGSLTRLKSGKITIK